MLTAERYQRLSDCADNAELKKCLSEFGYTGDTVDGMLSRAADEIYAYLNDGSPIDTVRRVLLKKNDYHNAKAMVKCKYARREITPELLYPHANIDLSVMKECVLNDEYARLPAPMARALSQIDLRFSKGERSGRVADAVLTRATYEDIFGTLGKNYAELKEVFAAEVEDRKSVV